MILNVEHREQLLIQRVEKRIHRFGQIHFASGIVQLQFPKQIGKDISILLVDGAICSLEHGVKFLFRFGQQLFEEL
jgi:hypothetical protein